MADTYMQIRHFTVQRTPVASPDDPAYDFSEALEFERQPEGDDKLLRSIICHPVEEGDEVKGAQDWWMWMRGYVRDDDPYAKPLIDTDTLALEDEDQGNEVLNV